jgi:hypothetical protein
MSRWSRVFGATDVEPEPAALVEHLHHAGFDFASRWSRDERGWFRVHLLTGEDEDAPIELQRYMADEEGIRAELNTWAAWLESIEDHPQAVSLMGRLIASRQVFTLERPDDVYDVGWADELCDHVCRYLAAATDGVYQVDGRGLCAADGSLLVPE